MRVRHSLRELELPENEKKKNDFLKAWKLIQELPPSNPNSYWSIATYHGMPFKARRVPPLDPSSDTPVWGGYCQHANVLFPTWHRFYCLRVEQALQTVLPDGDVALHYWDETSEESLKLGIPKIAMDKTVMIDGVEVDNPLRNFTIPREITGKEDSFYAKPAGYTTTRYPYSGIRNPPAAYDIAMIHNEEINAMPQSSDELLQENVVYWLNRGRYPVSPDHPNSVYKEFQMCLEGADYNKFSNTTSSTTSLEQPHNDVHLMVGGFTEPELNSDGSVKVDDEGEVVYFGLIKGSNGDMGANECASFDPIFFLHHCNIDRMFWVWQKKWGHTNNLSICPEGPNSGTSTDGESNQGMTPNQTPDEVLGMDTILYPYQDEFGVPRTSRDCVNVEDLGYTYSIGSLDKCDWPAPKYTEENVITDKVTSWQEIENRVKEACEHKKEKTAPIRAFFDRTNMPDVDPKAASCAPFPMFISGGKRGDYLVEGRKFKARNFINVDNLDKESIAGSFSVQAYYKKDGKLFYIGQRGVLDRWDRENCANCQKHRDASVGFLADGIIESSSDMSNLLLQIVSKDPATGKLKVTKFGGSTTFAAGVGMKEPRVRFFTELEEDVDAE